MPHAKTYRKTVVLPVLTWTLKNWNARVTQEPKYVREASRKANEVEWEIIAEVCQGAEAHIKAGCLNLQDWYLKPALKKAAARWGW